MSPMRTLRGSADAPLHQEDRGSFVLREGTRQRLLGQVRQLLDIHATEAKVVRQWLTGVRHRRRHQVDVVEIYAGFGNITAEALQQGLRALQPVDQVHGILLESRQDHVRLRDLLTARRPFLTIWEIRCDPWSHINYLNYTKEELQVLRETQRLPMSEMARTIRELHEEGCHFLLENPWGTDFWRQPEVMSIMNLPGADLRKGALCNFGLRGGQGLLLKKDRLVLGLALCAGQDRQALQWQPRA